MKRFLMVTLVIFVVAGCSDAGLVGPEQGEEELSTFAAKNHAVPAKDRAWGSGVFAGAPGDCTVDGMPGLPVRMWGEGISSHLGRITFVQDAHCLNLADLTYEGRTTITAANGDELRATYSGVTLGDGSFESNGRYVGGTGRFDGAMGSFVQHGVSTDPSTGSFTFEFSSVGTIVY